MATWSNHNDHTSAKSTNLEQIAATHYDRIVRTAARLFDAAVTAIVINQPYHEWAYTSQEIDTHDALIAYLPNIESVVRGMNDSAHQIISGVDTSNSHLPFYTFCPIKEPGGRRAGVLCLLDQHPRALTDNDYQALADLQSWAELALADLPLTPPAKKHAPAIDFGASISQYTSAVMLVVDDQWRIVWGNSALEKFSRLPLDKLLYQHITNLLPEYPTHLLGSPKAAYSLRRDGSHVPVWVEEFPILKNRGSFLALTVYDITLQHLSEEQLNTVVDNAPIVLFAINREGLFTLAKGAALATLVGTVRDITGESMYTLFQNAPDILDNLQRCFQGESFTARVKLNGAVYATHYRPLYESSSTITGVLGVATDVTEQVRAENALRESSLLLTNILASITDAFFALDTDWRFTYVNTAAERLLWRPAQELLGKPLWNMFPNAIGSTYNQLYDTLYNSSQVLQLEVLSSTTNRWLEVYAYPSTTGVVVYLRDITERKHAEQALQQSQARNRALIHAIPDMMLRLSADGVILDYKANRDSYLLALPQLLLGKNVQDVMPPIVAQKTQAAISQALHSDGTHIFEYSLLEDNKQLDFEARVVICGHDEVLVIVRDITERKKIDRMKNEFVSIVSHELRTPLTAISGALGLLSGNVLGQLPPKAVEMIDIAHRNTKRLIRLINDLLDIDKIESGNMVYQLKSLDIVPLVIQSIQANQAYAAQFGVQIQLEAAPEAAWVHANSDALIQVMTNLLSNAIKFSPRDEQVYVKITHENHRVRVAITDNGPGIPVNFHGSIFQKFAQADASNARQKGGTGLGLSISRAIIERLQGSIDFVTSPDNGTTFFFELPELR